MKVRSVKKVKSAVPAKVADCFVGDGYLPMSAGSLPDVDIDFQSDRRQEVKAYLERRYNHDGLQRVFSAGTFTTMMPKAVIKDVARVMKVPPQQVNFFTSMLDKKETNTWGDVFRQAFTDRKIAAFIHANPEVFEAMRPLLFQPRSSSVHASALVITPEHRDGQTMECFDYTPIKKVDGVLVSEFSGANLDSCGLLKNDVLGIIELTKFQQMFYLSMNKCGDPTTFQDVVTGTLDDPEVYKCLSMGHTQGIFQVSGDGMTKYLKEMRPNCFSNIVATLALFRPGPLSSGASRTYIDCHRGDSVPHYLWGTEEYLKDTYGQLTYQEQVAFMVRGVAGFTMSEAAGLAKLISKKKADKIKVLKDKFMKGAAEHGCPDEDAMKIWDLIESCATYLFNKCIDGDESILGAEYGDWRPTIAEMHRVANDADYARSIGRVRYHRKFRYGDYGYGWSLSDDCPPRLVKNRIKDIRYAGKRKVYRVTLSNGASVVCTDNHKHPTTKGMKMTYELQKGDMLYSTDGNALEIDRYRLMSRKKQLELEAQLRYKRKKKRPIAVSPSALVSVEECGEKDVYNVEMAAPFHTFATAGGFVTGNCHATAYALNTYADAWMKVHHPTAFYTVILQHAKDDEVPAIISEMEVRGTCRLKAPEINHSSHTFYSDFDNDTIFWSLTKIKQVGVKASEYIVAERERNGAFTGIVNFMERVFRYKLKKYEYWDDPDNPDEVERCPVTARHVLNMIFSGCFDAVENITSAEQRMRLVTCAMAVLGIKKAPEIPASMADKPWWWEQRQIDLCGVGSIDYRRIYDTSELKPILKGKGLFIELKDISKPEHDGRRCIICATVSETEVRHFKSKKTNREEAFMKLQLWQNGSMTTCTVWPEELERFSDRLDSCKGCVVVLTGVIKYDLYTKGNVVGLTKSSRFEIL